jgi:hypothetical protein
MDHRKYNEAWLFFTADQYAEWAKKVQPPRPKFPARSSGLRLFFSLIVESRRIVFASDLPAVASDYMDGRYTSDDMAVKQLLDAGVLEEVPIEGVHRWRPRQKVTWHLTPYACAVLLAYSPVPPTRVIR